MNRLRRCAPHATRRSARRTVTVVDWTEFGQVQPVSVANHLPFGHRFERLFSPAAYSRFRAVAISAKALSPAEVGD